MATWRHPGDRSEDASRVMLVGNAARQRHVGQGRSEKFWLLAKGLPTGA